MLPLVECVPNFSEGRDQRVIDAITDAIRFTPGADLLHVDIGPAANRTVCTFTGPPDAVATAALAAARVAVTRIDMRTHTGAHPRMGALDVCPFVPLQGVDMAQCVALARSVGAQLAADLGVPVYLYGEAAHRSHRRELATVRSGEYEGLPARMSAPARRPDLGPAEVHPWGASAVGARRILVAFNVNLNTTDVRIARRIAVLLRERGRGQHAGLLQGIRAIGWYIAPFGRCQVSMNLIDHQRTPPHAA
ncbi:MAG: glutamate formiminotransferase/formiminotetrahydrofolate cyclodeaminase, partial [Myxococcota bacterium]